MESRPPLTRRAFAAGALAVRTARKRIVFIAGPQSHAYGQHAHYAGCALLAQCLRQNLPAVETRVFRDEWPDPAAIEGASAVVLYADGGEHHPMLPHLSSLERVMAKGAGLAVLHYALCVPKGEAGNKLLRWIGGYYEEHWSVNPFWSARFDALPRHPVASGVEPFAIRDEWYYHMRFQPGMKGVTPVLTATPPDKTRQGPDGPHSGNPTVRSRKGMPEHVAWVYQRPEGGRGFGLTGGHYHWAWGADGFRQVVLNAIAWTAGIEMPPGGVPAAKPTWKELTANQEVAPPIGFGPEDARKAIGVELPL